MKKYTIWTDETFWGESARNSGIVYGIYNNVNNKKEYSHEEEFGIITSRERALEVAKILNERES